MKIKYLGTAAYEGIPGLFCQCELCQKATQLGGKNIRSRSGMIINNNILMDFCPDMYLHKLRFGLDLGQITDIFITHSHTDHFVPGELMISAEGEYSYFVKALQGKKIRIYGNPSVKAMMDSALKSEFPKGQQTIEVIEVTPFTTITLEDMKVTPLLADHQAGEDCLIYLLEQNGNTLLYGNDTGIFPELTFNYLKGHSLDFVSLDCTGGVYGGKHYHMGFMANNEVKETLSSLGCLHVKTQVIATHFSHNCKMLHEELESVGASYGIGIAYDGLEVTLE
ncbi:MAG: MBL fold metallo-hydrolase [Cellulosilyticaceae bacterium]